MKRSIDVSSLLNDPKLSALRAKIPSLANAVQIIPLGGLTNTNYCIQTPTDKFVLRISNPSVSVLGIDRENERINTERAHQSGVGAAVVDSLPDENILVIRWIHANTLHAADLKSQPDILPRIATALKMLHSGPKFKEDFHFPTVRKKYKTTVLEKGYFLPDGYLKLEPSVIALEKILTSIAEELVPCNNDLLAENLLDDGKKIWIIDFEYSGNNEASFEIGNLAAESFLTEEQLTLLCDSYWKKHEPLKIARAMAWSMIARYGWVLWASIQEAISPIDFDFRSWGMRKWNSVLPELQGDRYKKIITTLKQGMA